MGTRYLIHWGEALQVLLDLIHHLMGLSIFVDSMVLGRAFVTQAKGILGGPADVGKFIFRTLVGIVYRTIRLLLFDGDLRPTAALCVPPMAQSRSGLDRLFFAGIFFDRRDPR